MSCGTGSLHLDPATAHRLPNLEALELRVAEIYGVRQKQFQI
jgi:hypothetical protein